MGPMGPGLGGAISAMRPPAEMIAAKIQEFATQLRSIFPLIQQVNPGVMVYFEKGLEAFNVGLSQLQSNTRPAQGAPNPLPGPLEPPAAPGMSAAPGEEGGPPAG